MKEKRRKGILLLGITNVAAFVIRTVLVQTVDVQNIGQEGTMVGFAGCNLRFHHFTGVHMWIYTVTDWMALIPILVCILFGVMGLTQLVRRRSLFKVDCDIVILGIYYIIVIAFYLFFEKVPVNYRPILIDSKLEASYPSSTTLLVLSVMPTLMEQVNRRFKKEGFIKGITFCVSGVSLFMVLGRLFAGVHWLTDIVGGLLLSMGLFFMYKAAVLFVKKE